MRRPVCTCIVLLELMVLPPGLAGEPPPAPRTQAPAAPAAPLRIPRRMDEFSGELPEASNERPPVYQGRFGKPLGSGSRGCCHETRDGRLYCH